METEEETLVKDLKSIVVVDEVEGNEVEMTAETMEENGGPIVQLKFRNYVPHDNGLKQFRLKKPIIPTFEPPIVEENALNAPLSLGAKKPNWDLKRDVQKKLERLEKKNSKINHRTFKRKNASRTTDTG